MTGFASVSARRKLARLASSALLALLFLGVRAAAQAPHPAAAAGVSPSSPAAPPGPAKFIAPLYLSLGKTVKGRDIMAAVYGSGPKRVLIFGGIHGDEPH